MQIGTPDANLVVNSLIGLHGIGVDTAPLVQTMGRVTNSYKHLFLRALLTRIRKGDATPRFSDLFRGMLAEAWWPAFHYRLTLGRQDMVVSRLDRFIEDPDTLRLRPEDVYDYLGRVPFDIVHENGAKGLLRYVPTRLLSPWFSAHLCGVPDGQRDDALRILAVEQFDETRPLYRLETEGVVVHPAWMDAITEYAPIFDGWSDVIWLAFLEGRNPHASSLLTKIRPAFERASLNDQRLVWAQALSHGGACIYTGAPVDQNLFAVDHFLPHAFTGHDRFWNLTPTAPTVNFAKSDGLPPEDALDGLADQHAALWRDLHRLGPQADRLRRWRDDYEIDLGIDPVTAGPAVFRAAYREGFQPLFGIARRMGFPDWRPVSL